MTVSERGVAVVVDAGQLLVIRRVRGDRQYAVLPGGGVEPGETPGAAALRELAEETGLAGAMVDDLCTLDHGERLAHYFRVSVVRAPLILGGPEAVSQSADNRYLPEWVDPLGLDEINLRPPEIRAYIPTWVGMSPRAAGSLPAPSG